MTEHENLHHAPQGGADTEKRQFARLLPAGDQPLILYDLATIVGAVYQQHITVTRQGAVTKRLVDSLRPYLHGLPRYDEQQVDTYVNMIFKMSRQLGLIKLVSQDYEYDGKPFYQPSIYSRLEKWTQLNVYEQAREFLAHWRKSTDWRDIWSPAIKQWDAEDWDPLAARGLLVDLLSANIYRAECWYPASSLLDSIWLRGPDFLRPKRHRERKRKDDFPVEFRHNWEQCEMFVYLGILSSTLSELGIVSLDSSPADVATRSLSQQTRFKLTSFGALTLSQEQFPSTTRHSSRSLVVQPSSEAILLQFDPSALYQLLPFVEVKLVEQASRLTLTKASVVQGLKTGISADEILAILKSSCKKAIPLNVIRNIQDWAKTYRGAGIDQILHINVSSEALADELCSSPQWQEYHIEKIAPCRLLVHSAIEPVDFRWLLEEADIVVHD